MFIFFNEDNDSNNENNIINKNYKDIGLYIIIMKSSYLKQEMHFHICSQNFCFSTLLSLQNL